MGCPFAPTPTPLPLGRSWVNRVYLCYLSGINFDDERLIWFNPTHLVILDLKIAGGRGALCSPPPPILAVNSVILAK